MVRIILVIGRICFVTRISLAYEWMINGWMKIGRMFGGGGRGAGYVSLLFGSSSAIRCGIRYLIHD